MSYLLSHSLVNSLGQPKREMLRYNLITCTRKKSFSPLEDVLSEKGRWKVNSRMKNLFLFLTVKKCTS